MDHVGMSSVLLHELLGLQIPDNDCLVSRGGIQSLSCVLKGDGGDSISMCLQDPKVLTF